jgi:hypothetical protein
MARYGLFMISAVKTSLSWPVVATCRKSLACLAELSFGQMSKEGLSRPKTPALATPCTSA